MNELGFIAGRHDNHVGQGCHVGDVKSTPVGCSISSYQASSVHSKTHCNSQEHSESQFGVQHLAYVESSVVKSTTAVKSEAIQVLKCRLLPAKHPLSMTNRTAPVKKQIFKDNTCQPFT